MSRIGNKPIPVPSGVKIAMASDKIDVQGPKGKLSVAVPRGISFEQKEGVLNVKRESDEQRAVHGLARALVANAVHGVTQGFKKEMDIVGVGYRAELKGKAVAFALGKSHPVEFKIPEGIQIAVDKQTHLIISGADKGQVGQVAADIRSLRPPDPYKQKGIRITGERLKKKAGKAGAKRQRVHERVRMTVSGTAERPRLCVYRSLDHIYAQVIDDRAGKTLASASSADKDTKRNLKGGGNVAAAKVVGKAVADRAKAQGISKVVFDRGGYKYHGRVKALADAAREAGLQF